MGKSKVEKKQFLGMEVRVVSSEELLGLNSGVYVIEFVNERYKIGCANNINTRLSAYKPYKFMISKITFYNTSQIYNLEKYFLDSCEGEIFHGSEWFLGSPNYENFNKIYFGDFNHLIEEKQSGGEKFTKQDVVNSMDLIMPKTKMKEFMLVIDILAKGYKAEKIYHNNFMRFYNWFNSISEIKKYEVLEYMCPLYIYVDDLLDFINIYIGDCKFIMGKILKYRDVANGIMAKLIGVEGKVKKDDLRTYQNQTTVDLLDVHSFVRENFVNAYRFTGSHKKSKEMVYEAAMREYPLLDKKIA